MKKVLLFTSFLIAATYGVAQEYNTAWNDLSNYVKRMYMNEPFDGVRIIEDLDNCYLISVVAENSSTNTQAMNRKAEVKALSAANTFLNGTRITTNTIMHTTQTSDGRSYDEFEDILESRSMGYVQSMQLLANFDDGNGKQVFVYCKKMPMPERKQATKRAKRR